MAADDTDWAFRHRPALLEFARQLHPPELRGKFDLAGVVQKTLSEAAKADCPSPHTAAQLAWLKAALRHNYQDERRRLTARKRDVTREERLHSSLRDGDDSPSKLVTKEDELRRMLSYLARLPADQSEAVRMRYIDGMAVNDMATQLGKTRPAVAGLLRRGLAALREHLRSDSEKAQAKRK